MTIDNIAVSLENPGWKRLTDSYKNDVVIRTKFIQIVKNVIFQEGK